MKWGPVSEAEVLGKPSVPVGKEKRWCGVLCFWGEREVYAYLTNVLQWDRGEREQTLVIQPKHMIPKQDHTLTSDTPLA